MENFPVEVMSGMLHLFDVMKHLSAELITGFHRHAGLFRLAACLTVVAYMLAFAGAQLGTLIAPTPTTVTVDFFTVPTATFRVFFVFLVLSNERRRVVHFNVTDSPSAV